MRRPATPFATGLVSLAMIMVTVMAGEGSAAQDVRVVATAEPLAGPLEIELRPTAPVSPGKWTTVTAVIENNTGVPLTDLAAYLHADTTGLELRDGPVVDVRDLKPGKTTRARWRVRAHTPGSYVMIASIEGLTPGQHLLEAESDGQILQVVPKRRRRSPRWFATAP